MEPKSAPQKRYICSFPLCSAAYNKQWKLDSHLCKHTGVKPFACANDGCDKTFCTAYHLTRHELTHSGMKPFVCSVDDCSEAFTTNSNRERHVKRAHTVNTGDQGQEGPVRAKKYACSFEGCGLEFKKNKLLKLHVCEQHTQLPPYPCTYEGCAMRFVFPSKLKRHEKVHQGYPCKEQDCGFSGKTWTDYLKHRRDNHPNVVRCEQCDKTFRDAGSMRQHQAVHSEVRVVFRCPRDGCERSYTTLFNLQSHVRSFHEGLRPHACPATGCGKTFAMRQSLLRHSVVHDPGRKKLDAPAKKKSSQGKRSLASRLSGFRDPKKTAGKKSNRAPGPRPAHPEPVGLDRDPGPVGLDRDPGPVGLDRAPSPHPAPPGSVELVSLLQDTSLLCAPAVDTQGLTSALTAPLTL